MSEKKDIFVTSRCTEGEIDWEVPVNLRPRSEEEAVMIKAALDRKESQVTLSRPCPFCQRDHDFLVELPAGLSEHNLTPRPPATLKRSMDREITLGQTSLQESTFSTSGLQTLEMGQRKMPLPYRTPGDAAMLYNDGGMFVRNDDRPEILKKGLIMLELSQEIYEENKLYREAAYAATVAAEAHFKLGNRPKARELLDFARPHLGEERDQRLREHWQWVKDQVDHEAA